MFDDRADTFCLVTSDSDFAYLCRKLRERGATVCSVGETKTPDALRNASDQFFEWVRPVVQPELAADTLAKPLTKDEVRKPELAKPELLKPVIKRRPRFVIDAVTWLASDTPKGKVSQEPLGQYLKRTDPAFSPKFYGYSGLLDMVMTYDLLLSRQEPGGHWSVSLAPKTDLVDI